MKCFIVLASVLALGLASPRLVKRESTPDEYELPSNATVLLGGQINTGFDCAGRQYGYYADQNNNCQIFHICLPYEDPFGTPHMRMWSFICGEGTVFDQAQLICNYPEYSFPCENADDMYSINDYFGKEDVQFRDGTNGIN